MKCIGKPGEEPRLFVTHLGFGDYTTQDGEVIFDVEDAPAYDRCVINATGDGLDPYVPELDEARKIKVDRLKKTRVLALGLGCWTPKGEVDTDPDSRAMLLFHATHAGNDPTYSILWTMKDNTDEPHTAPEIVAAHRAVAAYTNAVHQHYRGFRAKLAAASTVAEVDAIDIRHDWPEIDSPVPDPVTLTSTDVG